MLDRLSNAFYLVILSLPCTLGLKVETYSLWLRHVFEGDISLNHTGCCDTNVSQRFEHDISKTYPVLFLNNNLNHFPVQRSIKKIHVVSLFQLKSHFILEYYL